MHPRLRRTGCEEKRDRCVDKEQKENAQRPYFDTSFPFSSVDAHLLVSFSL